ncbi:MAG TPA: cupin domain-containing protein [Pyrinomonadaceae bacterium]
MKRTGRLAAAITLLWLPSLGAVAARAQEPSAPAAATLKSHIMLTPEEVKWGECPPALPAGAKCAAIEGDLGAANALFGYRVKMPDNYRIPPHFHPADEHVVVLSGVFNMGHGDKLDTGATRALAAGSFAVMPKGAHHFAWTKGETVVHVYAVGPWGLTYVNPKDDPRNR